MPALLQTHHAPAPTDRERREGFRLWSLAGPVWVSMLLLCAAGGVRAADPYVAALDKCFAAKTITAEAEDKGIAYLDYGIRCEARELANGPGVVLPPASGSNTMSMELVLALLLAGVVGVVGLGPVMNRRWNQWLEGPVTDCVFPPGLLATDSGIAEFCLTLREGPHAVLPAPAARDPEPRNSAPDQPGEAQASARASLQKRLASVGRQLARFRALFSDFNRPCDKTGQLRDLGEVLVQLELLTHNSALPGLRPIWLMAFALHGLVKQLSSGTASPTPSALRTTTAGLDLLSALCTRSLTAPWTAEPRVRLLVVDDDPITRRALSFSLTKAFSRPDLAPDGHAALALAAQHPYDVIFLDVEMPGMDGFELCSKIRETVPNRTTPVIFVTCHTDFDSRAQSILVGGNDFIAKPFLTFEITVKALTAALGSRLGNSKAALRSANNEAPGRKTVVKAAGGPGLPSSVRSVSPVGLGTSPEVLER
jgi:CheY-like chemotaxis protein